MDAPSAIRAMIAASGKSGRQVSREIGRSSSFLSASLAQGVCPRTDTFARVAHACGYKLVAIPQDTVIEATSGLDPLTIEYDGN